jgi:chromosome segregation ATPase
MSEIAGIIDTLEGRIEKLLRKIDVLEKQNRELREEISKTAGVTERQSQQIAELKSANETLRIANSLLGSEENKRDTKLKINSLIREIDYCIAQLAD